MFYTTRLLSKFYPGVFLDSLTPGGPTSCRRSSKQAAKHKSIVYFVFVYIFRSA